MKADWTELNRFRVRSGRMGSNDDVGRNGAFMLRRGRVDFIVIASSGEGWDHVSVRARGLDLRERVPTWEEMCWIKDQFWDAEEWVVQFHPAHSEYVNNHPHVLHLWRSQTTPMPTPPSILVGLV